MNSDRTWPKVEVVNFADLPSVLKAGECAEVLRVGRRQCYALLSSGRIQAVRVGNSWRIPKTSLARFLGVEFKDSQAENEPPTP